MAGIGETAGFRRTIRVLVPSTLFVILAILVIVPFLTLLYASLITAAPFSGNGADPRCYFTGCGPNGLP